MPDTTEQPVAHTGSDAKPCPLIQEALEKDTPTRNGGIWLARTLCDLGYPLEEAQTAVRNFCERSNRSAEQTLNRLRRYYADAQTEAGETSDPIQVGRKRETTGNLVTISLFDTANRAFAPTDWIVPELIHVGANILSGDPKSGKSFLCLQIAAAVAEGGKLFDAYKVDRQGWVLYLAIEDGERRIHKRVKDLGISAEAQHFVDMLYDLPDSLSTSAGMAALERKLHERPYRLLVVDTLAAVCDEGKASGGDIFRQQYKEMKFFQQLAERHQLAALISTHNRKGESKTALEKIGGTYGRAAAVNGNMILEKTRERTTLQVRSRDAEDSDIPLKWGGKLKGWSLLCEADIPEESREHDILAVIRKHGPQGSTAVWELLEKSGGRSTIVKYMSAMLASGVLRYDKETKTYSIALEEDTGEGFMGAARTEQPDSS